MLAEGGSDCREKGSKKVIKVITLADVIDPIFHGDKTLSNLAVSQLARAKRPALSAEKAHLALP